MTPEGLMQKAIDAAWKYQGLTYPNPAVGCCVTGSENTLLSVAAHQKAGGPHAEVLALKEAYHVLSGDDTISSLTDSKTIHDYLKANHHGCFRTCTLYVTLEPCVHEGKTPACSELVKVLGLKKVIIAHEDRHAKASGGATMLRNAGIEVEVGLLREKAHALLIPFLRWQEKRFVCFKWAQRLDGTIDGGTISSEASRLMVHAMRDGCDLLVIGGNTVREDRPTLDARMVNGKAPDILILSSQKTFDQTIPLFAVEGRNVFVEASFDRLRGYKNILIEGGPRLFEATRALVDYYLCFVAPQSGGTIPFTKSKLNFETLYLGHSGSDTVMWLKGK